LACELLVENAVQYFQTHTFTIEPLNVAPAVRDLMIDSTAAYERINQAQPYIIQSGSPPSGQDAFPIMPQRLDLYVNATRCINCFCCASACISSHNRFLGPNAMLASIVRVMDPREHEKAKRLKLLYSEQGIYRCHSARACSFVCPKEIDVAHFIALAKAGRILKPES
jgi:succinate dehydrogenase / fumarate reductase iron-sulfur subunit